MYENLFFFEDKEILQNFNNILDKVKIYLKNNLIVNLCIVINILKLKKICTIYTFMVLKCLEKNERFRENEHWYLNFR